MKRVNTILSTLIVLCISIQLHGQEANSKTEIASQICSDIMQQASDISSDVQQLIALTARGNQPINTKEAKVWLDQLRKEVLLLQKNSEKLLKYVGKDKKLVFLVKNMISELRKTQDILAKFSTTVLKGGKDSATIKLGGELRHRFSKMKSTAQYIRQELRAPNNHAK